MHFSNEIQIPTHLADDMELTEIRRKDLQLSKFMDSKVNVMERYTETEGRNNKGHYGYLRYQVLKTPAGKLDLTYAMHTTSFELPTSTKGEITSSSKRIFENIDEKLVRAHLRYTPLTKLSSAVLFEL